MQYTFEQACKAIAPAMHAYGTVDAKSAINKAIQALAGMSGWECLRKVVRVISAHPEFALPQGCAGLVRACINGDPVSIRGQDFQFLHSGPGDIRAVPKGYTELPNSNIIDRGYHPIFTDPVTPFKVFAVSTGDSEPPVVLKVVNSNGRIVHCDVDVADSGTDVAAFPEDDMAGDFLQILSVTLDRCASHYLDIYCQDATGQRYLIASCHPEVKVPVFHRYEIQGMTHGPVDILAEVRIDPLPLVEDTDVVPFDTLEPIEWMTQMAWCTKSGELETAQKLSTLAVNWLKAKETVANKVQTILVANSLYKGSLGELSAEAVNI